jgi:hypothetical protein
MLQLWPNDGPKPCPMEYYTQSFVLSVHGDSVFTELVDKFDK